MDPRPVFAALLDDLCRACRELYGDRLISLVIFGSVGRGTATAESDVDVLVVARDLPRGRIPRVEEFAAVEQRLAAAMASARQLGVTTRLSPLFKTPDEVAVGSPLFLDMTEDAKLLFDRDGSFAGVLRALAARLATLGAKRVWRGRAWYWDLKPDFKPGEIIEI